MPPLFWSLFFVFHAFWQAEADSQFVPSALIQQGASACCAPEWRHCCAERMLQDGRIHCPGLDRDQAQRMGVCLERLLHGGESVIAQKAHKCCWLLSGDRCRERCYAQLRAPTIPPGDKFTFTDLCPHHVLPNASVPIAQLDCISDRDAVLHSCFPACLHWWAQHGHQQEGHSRQQLRFEPTRDCRAFGELMQLESCLVPVQLMEGLQRDRHNATGPNEGP